MTGDWPVYLAHILGCVQKIERSTANGRARFVRGTMVQGPVFRNFEVIGRAALKELRYGG